jgi:hypothetical protein
MKTLSRRLHRLEARVRPRTTAVSFLIRFVDADKRVTCTLQHGPGDVHVWTDLPSGGEAHNALPEAKTNA